MQGAYADLRTSRRLRTMRVSIAFGQSRAGKGVVTIIALVGNKRLDVRQHWTDQSRALSVTHLSFCEKKDNCVAGAIANRVQLGV